MESMGFNLAEQIQTYHHDMLQCHLYVLCYMNDILCTHYNADIVLLCLNQSFTLKPLYGDSDMSLGTKSGFHNEIWALAMSPTEYDYVAVKSCKAQVGANGSGTYRVPKVQRISFLWDVIKIGTSVQT